MGIDSSEHAISLAEVNKKLNHATQVEFIKGDARDYLSLAKNYNLIILDPPKLAPSKNHLIKAKNYYRFLHGELFKAMLPGTLLFTCNCSAALSAHEFLMLIQQQAKNAKKMIRVLGVFGPALCHPTLVEFPEGRYLTGILLVVL